MKKGFTLLELLVVVAIIGLLAAIVMVVVSTAQKKANLSYVQQSMDQIRKQTELFIANNGSPGPTGTSWIRESIIDTFGCTPDCFPEDPTIKKIMKSVYPRLDIYHPSDPQKYFIYSIKGNDWAIAAWSVRNNLNIYCIDSTGRNISRRYTGTASAPVITNGACVK